MTAGPGANPTAILKAVDAALQAGDVPRATTLAREALVSGLEHPVLLNLRAHWFESQGRDAEAFADLHRAQTLAPDSAPINNALGMSFAKAGRHRDAIACFDAALAADANFAAAHFNKAWNSEQLGDVGTARESYRRAQALMPRSAEPPAHLAAIAARLGDWREAEELAKRALAVDARHPKALSALALVEAADGNPAAAETRLKTLLARTDVPASDRSAAEAQLGDVLDAQGRAAEAFAVYAAANEALRRQYAPQFEKPGVETTPMALTWNLAEFARSSPADWLAAPGPARIPGAIRHVFLIGFPRSGTTLLEQILGAHPAVETSGEKDTLIEGTRDFLQTQDGFRRLAAVRDTGALQQYRNAYWRRVREYGIDVAGRVFADKQPYNIFKLPLIAKLFPAAKVVFSVRDPRDVVLGCFRRRFLMSKPNYEFLTLEGAARFYDLAMRVAQTYRAGLPLEIRTLRHEDLIADFEAQVRGICDCIGLEWNDSMRAFQDRARSQAISTPSSVQVRQGLNVRGIGHWRQYADPLAPILPILQPWVEQFGYAE